MFSSVRTQRPIVEWQPCKKKKCTVRILSHSHTKLKESLGSIDAEEDCSDRSKVTDVTVYLSFGVPAHCRFSDKWFPGKSVTLDLNVRMLMCFKVRGKVDICLQIPRSVFHALHKHIRTARQFVTEFKTTLVKDILEQIDLSLAFVNSQKFVFRRANS